MQIKKLEATMKEIQNFSWPKRNILLHAMLKALLSMICINKIYPVLRYITYYFWITVTYYNY